VLDALHAKLEETTRDSSGDVVGIVFCAEFFAPELDLVQYTDPVCAFETMSFSARESFQRRRLPQRCASVGDSHAEIHLFLK
jgi:hypothetical protein